MGTFVVGDIHGSYLALQQCIEKSGFDPANDTLILLGDVCDGYPDVRQSVEYLLTLDNCQMVLGNHDLWAIEWGRTGFAPDIWLRQGGKQTISSYEGGPMPAAHLGFLSSAALWIEKDNRLYVHGGINPLLPLGDQDRETCIWDRTLLANAVHAAVTGDESLVGDWETVYIGHTPTAVYGSSVPLHLGNLMAMDTGAGWSGFLTMIDVDTGNPYFSDPSPLLYPGIRPRG